MKNIPKILTSVILAVVLAFSFSSCAKTEMTEENITDTVSTVETALKEFDSKTLEKYVSSSTLSYIMKYAENHQQFVDLGKAIFKDLEITVTSVDVENRTVTLDVKNKNLKTAASIFALNLKDKYTTMQLLQKLDDEAFLDESLGTLVDSINSTKDTVEATVTLKVVQGKRNLVLSFDDDGEDAVSGGALTGIKNIYK
ncbi:hypothetical protein [uncultured Eubacterium sp.]|uniref:hypothetical protein n=1 Tax=uncultured Eubacterium sp. TaxID=165185 RepID=UPI0025F06573|nr:hypothetical protein [uncultured Eubacterium sp.]